MTGSEIEEFLTHYTETIRPLLRERGLASWAVATTGEPSAAEREAELRAALMTLHADRERFGQLQAWMQAPPADPLLARQLRVTYLAFARNQMDEETIRQLTELDKEVGQAFINFRGSFKGRLVSNNEIEDVLSSSTDSETLQEAWEASKQIGSQVAGTVLELVRLRNEAARRLGYPDYYQMGLSLGEIDPGRLFEILDELGTLTDEPFRQAKAKLDRTLARRYDVPLAALRPWHYHDPFFQRPPQVGAGVEQLDEFFTGVDQLDLARRTFTPLGMEIDAILAGSDLYAREGKDQHAFCIMIDRDTLDVRILCNLQPNLRWTTTLLHELGHALYDRYLPLELPFLLRAPAHTASTEAIAMLFGRLGLNPEWQRSILGVPADVVAELAPVLNAQGRLGMLIFVRWELVMLHFERAMYADPEQDLNKLWWDLVERYQFLTRPEGRDAPDWAAKLHLARNPVYYQNYLLGELMASPLQRTIERRYGGIVDERRAGRFLIEEYFAQGATADWDRPIERATGERLQPRYFV
ncbi:MAG TPA: M2 family metallopeptidase, partial [Ardenticatenaceae bacterium]|nr:M2 family metallopeptidase [Ardenticatenaceae bacterium]